MTMAALGPYCACCTRPAGGEASGRENVCSGPALNRQEVIDLGLHAVGRNQAVWRGLHALSATGLCAKNSAPGSIIRPAKFSRSDWPEQSDTHSSRNPLGLFPA